MLHGQQLILTNCGDVLFLTICDHYSVYKVVEIIKIGFQCEGARLMSTALSLTHDLPNVKLVNGCCKAERTRVQTQRFAGERRRRWRVSFRLASLVAFNRGVCWLLSQP